MTSLVRVSSIRKPFGCVPALAGTVAAVGPWNHGLPANDSAVIAAAVASYRADQLPGTAVPAEPAPRLTPLHLRLVGAAVGQLHGMAVTVFAYSSPSGARLTIVQGRQPFPEAAEAHELGGTQDAWTVRSGGVTVICAQRTHAMLLLGTDTTLVHRAGALLNAI